ncbi:MAG TPA: guanylate kinase [Verrucomicrobiae bacterium]
MSPNASNALLIVVSAPSGGGKTTLCDQLLATEPNLTRAVTSTTRPPRPGEQPGRDYYFFSPEEFQRRVAAGEFVEHATVFGRSYGVLRSELLEKLRSGKDVLLNVDVQGAAAFRAQAATEPELRRALVSIFLTPASLAELEGRLRRRNADGEAEIQKRLATARHELAQWNQFDYLVISTSIAEDLRRARVILEAEKMRVLRSAAPVF